VPLIVVKERLLSLADLSSSGIDYLRTAKSVTSLLRDWSEEWKNSRRTVVFGTLVPKHLGDFSVLKSICEIGGCAVAVEEHEITTAQHAMGS